MRKMDVLAERHFRRHLDRAAVLRGSVFADYLPAINRPEFSDSSFAKMLLFATENQNELQVTQQITIADQPCVDPFDVSGNSSARSLVRNARKSIRTSIPSSKLRSERLSVPSGQAMIRDHAPTSPWT